MISKRNALCGWPKGGRSPSVMCYVAGLSEEDISIQLKRWQ